MELIVASGEGCWHRPASGFSNRRLDATDSDECELFMPEQCIPDIYMFVEVRCVAAAAPWH